MGGPIGRAKPQLCSAPHSDIGWLLCLWQKTPFRLRSSLHISSPALWCSKSCLGCRRGYKKLPASSRTGYMWMDRVGFTSLSDIKQMREISPNISAPQVASHPCCPTSRLHSGQCPHPSAGQPYQVKCLVGVLEAQQHVLQDGQSPLPHNGVQQLGEDLVREKESK